MELSGILTNAVLVTYDDAPEELKDCATVYGNVVEDFKGRFDKGMWMYSSLVENIEGDLIRTRNSVYKIEGELKRVNLPIKAYLLIRDGIPPMAIRGLLDEGVTIEAISVKT